MQYICLLRAINVSGKRKIPMQALRELGRLLFDYAPVQSYLQSGNLIFSRSKKADLDAEQLSKTLSHAIGKTFGYTDVDVLVFDTKKLRKIFDDNPFQGKDYDTTKLYFIFLTDKPEQGRIKAIPPADYLPDEFAIGRGQSAQVIYVHCHNGYGRTKLTNSFFERKLKIRATTRNFKTTEKLSQWPKFSENLLTKNP